MDFGFLRASSDQYCIIPHRPPIVVSFDGFNSYLLIVDAKAHYTWVFLTATKSPPADIIHKHLQRFGCCDGYRAICVDHGGELFGSTQFCRAVADANYVLEPTSSGVHHRNGRVECLNRTFAVMVRALLYGAGLPPKFWSAALTHAVYLKNRLWHQALGHTPFEAFFQCPPDLSHLRIFGSLLIDRQPNSPRCKLDNHTTQGIFLHFMGDGHNVCYIDTHTGQITIGGSFHFDEAHFMASTQPPAVQLLFDLGLHLPTPPAHAPATDIPTCVYPACLLDKPITPLPVQAGMLPLPPAEIFPPTHSHSPPHAAAASVTKESPSISDVLQLSVSDDPLSFSFQHRLCFDGDHPTAGLILSISDHGRLCLDSIAPSTPAAKVPTWRSRLRGAYLLSINNIPVATINDVHRVFSQLRLGSQQSCT